MDDMSEEQILDAAEKLVAQFLQTLESLDSLLPTDGELGDSHMLAFYAITASMLERGYTARQMEDFINALATSESADIETHPSINTFSFQHSTLLH